MDRKYFERLHQEERRHAEARMLDEALAQSEHSTVWQWLKVRFRQRKHEAEQLRSSSRV